VEPWRFKYLADLTKLQPKNFTNKSTLIMTAKKSSVIIKALKIPIETAAIHAH
jgi:hypothetical protein